ncbi:hypothetical protein P280DRAFT_517281 [Massarina eburnea CBS 473.64]|uniref:Uncharacterized protein n=1 Tax=Massarina eburnea CBS 473.64 TaxID=1395130 RepID=A0A6A6RZQ4_9PLEO|nr:hypothetical protein P280DRAFT_517281 [Massarina eburnea CBS 473.64]
MTVKFKATGYHEDTWAPEVLWSQVGVYDIASHNWWWQNTTGAVPSSRVSSCAVSSTSPNGSAFHITVYGSWSLKQASNSQLVAAGTVGHDGMKCVLSLGKSQMILEADIKKPNDNMYAPHALDGSSKPQELSNGYEYIRHEMPDTSPSFELPSMN